MAKLNLRLWIAIFAVCGVAIVAIAEILLKNMPPWLNTVECIGTTLFTAAVIGFILETIGWRKILENQLLEILTRPDAVRGMHITERGIKDKIRGLIEALYPKAVMPNLFYSSIENVVIDRLTEPVREDMNMTLELQPMTEKGKSFIIAKHTMSYIISNYSGEKKPLFGQDNHVRTMWVEIPSALRSTKNIQVDRVYKFHKLLINDDEKKVKKNIARETNAINVEITYSDVLEPRISDDFCQTHIAFAETSAFEENDLFMHTFGGMTLGFKFTLIYPYDKIRAYVLTSFPPYKPYTESKERDLSPGHKVLEVEALISPGYSFGVYWYKK